jgi:hypothetical protein
MSSPLTFTDKEIRKYEKKARLKEQKYLEQGGDKFLQQRDEFLDKAQKLRDNRLVDHKRNKRKIAESQKTDDQLLNEALRQNRRERNDAEKKRKIQMEKEANLKELRYSAKMAMKEKGEEKEKVMEEQEEFQRTFQMGVEEEKKEFKKKYLEEYPDTSDSQIQKIFIRYYNNQIQFVQWKNKMVNIFMSLGMTEEDALNEFQKMIDNQSKDTEDPIEEESLGIQTIMDKVEVEEEKEKEIVLEDPIPEEEIVHLCTHEDCIESTDSFETEDACMEHLQKEHLQINENPRL